MIALHLFVRTFSSEKSVQKIMLTLTKKKGFFDPIIINFYIYINKFWNIFVNNFFLTVLCSNTSPEMAPEWEEVFNEKEEPNKDVFCYMGEQHFSLFLLHFSWYTVSGEDVQARNFCVTAYHTSFHQENEDFKVRVYFIPIIPNSSVGQQVYFIFSTNFTVMNQSLYNTQLL